MFFSFVVIGLLGTFDGRTADNANVTRPPNDWSIGGLHYRFPVGSNTQVNIYALSDGANELGFTVPINPYFESTLTGGSNGISRFSRRALVYQYVSSILIGVRFSLGIMWLSLIVAEQIAADSGIGYMAMNAREFMQTDVVVLSIIIYALLGKLTNSTARALENKFLSWNPNYTSAG